VDKPARTVSVEGDAGGLRSVLLGPAETGGRPPTLLLGAACGVYEMGIDAAGPEKIYLAQPREQTRGGFNAVAANDDWIVASHSEQGLIAWRRGDPQEPIGLIPKLTASAGAVRNAQFARGRLWCSVDDRLVSLPADDLNAAPKVVSGGRSAIAALCVTGDGVYAGNADGEVLFWKDTDRPTVLHAGSRRAAESVNVLPTGGIVRLFYTDTSLAVYSRVVGDTFTCRYEAGGQTIRRAETAPDLIAGTNDLRDRVIIWTPNTPAQPTAVIPLARLTGRSVQDVCLVPIT